jgi:hypothetical protein
MSLTSGNERICVQKFLPQHAHIVDNINKSSGGGHTKLAAAFYKNKLWPKNSVIYVSFSAKKIDIPITKISEMDTTNGPVDPLQLKYSNDKNLNIIEAVKEIIKQRIEPLVKPYIKFEFTTENNPKKTPDHVKISFDPEGGAWSLVGTDCVGSKKPTMNLGWFDVATTMHEFGHVLGMVHEHQSSKETIQWNDNAVYEWAEQTQGWNKKTTQTNILNKYANDKLNASSFDPCSIMLYFFPASLTLNNQGTNQNLRISPNDAIWIEKNYPGSSITPSQFFHNAYNEDLQTIQKNCIKIGGKLTESPSNNSNRIKWMVIIAIIIFGPLLALLIFKMVKKLKNNFV